MRKSGSTVAAAGRRMDLASLFCMIGRHGPAVALAVIVMVSVLAIVIIYRTVRGKRRKATAEAAAADSDGQSRGVEDRELSVIQPSRGELLHSSSTDVSDEDLSYVKEDVDLIQSDRKIRHRQAAAAAVEKKPSPYSPPKSEIQVPDPKHTTLDGTEEMAVVWDYYKVSEPYVEEANQSLQSDTSTLAKMVVEKAGDCRRVATENVFEDVIEEVHDNHSCLKEPEPITEETHGQEEKVIIAECQEDVTTEKDVSDEKTRQEEETPHVSESYDADGLQENTTTLETNTVESDCVENFIHIDNVPDPCISYCKDKGFEEDNQDSIDNSNYSSNSHLSPEERTTEGEEAEEECVDHQQTTEPDEMWSSTFEQETNMPSTQRDQCDHVPDSGTPAMQESDLDEDVGRSGEVIEKPLSTLTDVKLDAHLPHFEKQDAEIMQSESVLTCYQEDIILDNGADQEKQKILTSDNVAFGEECDGSNVAASPALACLSTPGKDVTHDESGITINAQNVGVADFPDLSSPHQEDTISPSLEEEADCTNLGPQMPSHEIENQPESPKNDTTVTLAEEHTDDVYEPHVQYCCKDELSVQTITNEVFDKASVAVPNTDDNFTASMSEEKSQPDMLVSSQEVSVAADPETAENITDSVTVEEVSCPHLQSICQGQQSDHVENTETVDETSINSATEEPACDNASITLPLMSEDTAQTDMLASSQEVSVAAYPETAENITVSVTVEGVSCPHLQSICQDQQSDHMENSKTVDETSINSATEEPACDNASITLPLMSEETAQPDMLASSQEVSVVADPETAENITVSVTVEGVSCPHLPSICQDQQSDHMENTETFDEMRVKPVSEEPACDNASITLPTMSEEISHPDMLASSQEVSVVADPETAENITVSVTVEGVSCPHLPSICQDQQSDHMENAETVDEASVNSAREEHACDNASITLPSMSEEISPPDMLASCQEVTVAAYPETAENITVSVTVEGVSCPHLPSICQDQQSDHMENTETVDEASINSATEEHACDNASITLPAISEEISHPDMLASCPDDSVAADPDTAENVTVSVTVEEVSCPHLPSICQDQQSDHMEITETIGEITVNSASEEPACDNASITLPLMSEEISQTDMLASCQEQTSDQQNEEMGNNFPDVTAPVMTEDITSPICQIHSLSFEQSDNAISIGVGEESGISSMAVSPDLQDAGNKLGTVENMVFSVMDYDKRPEGLMEPQNSLVADDEPISVPNEDTAGIVFGSYPQLCSKPPHNEPTDCNNLESFTANEDMLGHDIEDSYHIEMDQVAAQIAASFTTFTAELKKGTDMKAVVEVLEVDDKKAANNIENKEETKAEKEEEGQYETTEINIMEATMDCNEWIEDNDSEDLPLMNLSVPLFAQDHTKNKQFPTEECSAVTDTTCTDATEIPPPTEVKQTSTLSLVDENMENTKKVVAVPPMPQNVNVTFYVHYFPQSQYQMVAVTGNQQELGNWKGFIPLERAKDGHWTTVVSLPAESHVEWKFVVLDKGEVCRWEECGNRLLDTGYGDDLLVHKWWGIL